jgi:outer membrane receptor protein involved in Fe transport
MPGMRRLLYSQSEGKPRIANIATNADFSPSTGGTILNTTNNENIRSAQIDLSENIDFNKKFKNALKIGFSIQQRQRDFRARKMNFAKIQQAGGGIEFDDSLLTLDDGQIFDPANMGIQPNGKGGFMLEQIINPYDRYDASSFTYARYLMIDTKLGNMFRAIYGLRMESFYMNLQSTRDDRSPVDINTLVVDYLPSVNLIKELNEKQNLRFSYSKTLNRPEFRELAPFVFYDFTNRFTYSGNDTLVRCVINNFDLRYEIFPGKNQILSGSVFYKNFINPIEQRSNPNAAREVTYVNAEKAQNYGAEIEFRALLSSLLNSDTISWLDYFTIYSNLALINSKVVLSEKNKAIELDRRLQGQSNYVFNAGIQFQNFNNGLTATLSANRVGDRISIVGNVIEPDLWEKGRTVIDFQIGKNFFKNRLDVRLNIKDLLVQNQVFYNDMDKNQRYNADKDLLIISRNFGNEITMSATFKF